VPPFALDRVFLPPWSVPHTGAVAPLFVHLSLPPYCSVSREALCGHPTLLRHPAALLACCLRLRQQGPPILRPYCIDPQVCLCCFNVHCLVRWLYATPRVCQPYLWQRFCKFIRTGFWMLNAYSEWGSGAPQSCNYTIRDQPGICKSAAPLSFTPAPCRLYPLRCMDTTALSSKLFTASDQPPASGVLSEGGAPASAPREHITREQMVTLHVRSMLGLPASN